MYNRRGGRKTGIIIGVILAILVILLVLVFSIRIKDVEVSGNKQYTKEQIESLLFDGKWSRNSAFCYYQNRFKEHKSIPFIEEYKINFKSPTKVEVVVFEKSVVGCVSYMSSYMYFDKDGIVVESSTQELEGIPQISGVTFDSLAIHQPLSVEDPTIFDTILSITKLLTKYDLDPDEIRFGAGGELFLQLGDVKVALGTGENLDEKISRLQQLEGDLKDKSGTLHMENYTDETTHISLESAK